VASHHGEQISCIVRAVGPECEHVVVAGPLAGAAHFSRGVPDERVEPEQGRDGLGHELTSGIPPPDVRQLVVEHVAEPRRTPLLRLGR